MVGKVMKDRGADFEALQAVARLMKMVDEVDQVLEEPIPQ